MSQRSISSLLTDIAKEHPVTSNRATPPGIGDPGCGLYGMADAPGLGVAAAGQPVTLALFPDERRGLG